MRKTTLILVLLLLAIAVMPASAAVPLAVRFEVDETIASGGIFVATGPAVDAGEMCTGGDTVDLVVEASGRPGGDFRNLRVLKEFTCEDGSGTFSVFLTVRLDLTTHDTTANWRVMRGGAGDYTNLGGGGTLVGIPNDQGASILDIYTGTLH